MDKPDKTRLRVTITTALRNHLEESREKVNRTLAEEVEARLRDSLNAKSTDGLLLLHVGDGLLAWLKAVDQIRFFGINLEETAIFLLRDRLLEMGKHDVWWVDIVDQLPEPIRSANQDTPRYRKIREREGK